MAAKSERRPATYEDLQALPEHVVGELIEGVLYAHPRPAVPHAGAIAGLNDELGPPFRRGRGGPGGWVILDEPELHLTGAVLVPDLAGWRRERMPEIPAGAAVELAPDWVCEVFSPGTQGHDRKRKRPLYAANRVGWLWFVDPLEKYLEVFRLDGETYSLLGTHVDDAKARIEPFDAIELDLAVLWAR